MFRCLGFCFWLWVSLMPGVRMSEIKSNIELDLPSGHLKRLGDHRLPEPNTLAILDYIPSGKDFYTRFVRTRTPLLMKGVAKNWKAIKHWPNNTYLREKYGSVLMDVEMGKRFDGSHLNVRRTMNMSDFLDNFSTKSMYLDSPFPQSEMIDDLELPFCMQCPELNKTFGSAHLLFSSGNTSSPLHHDGYENLFVMISGQKVFRMINYTYGKELYVENMTSFPGLSPINPDAIDLLKYPEFAKVPYYEVNLEPGDLFYSPIHWWHQVQSFGSPNIAVSVWFYVFLASDETRYSDVLGIENYLAKAIADAPETIDCASQNKPFTAVLKTEDKPHAQGVHRHVLKVIVKTADGLLLPMIGIGTGAYVDKFYEDIGKIVAGGLAAGYRLIDTSPTYNETEVGKGIKQSNVEREKITIITKVLPLSYGFSKTVQSVAESLTRLDTHYVDYVLLNTKECVAGFRGAFACDGKDSERETWRDAWRALEYLIDIGRVKHIGVCNFDVADLEELKNFSRVPISIVQNWFDIYQHDTEVRAWAKKNNVTYVGFSTLGGIWESEFGYNPVLQEPRLQSIASDLNIDVARVVIHWAIRKGVIVLPRTRSLKHMESNLQVADFRLTEDEMNYIDSLAGTVNPSEFKESVHNRPQDSSNEIAETVGEEAETKIPVTHYSNLQEKVDPTQPSIFISSDDHWIYALDALSGQVRWKVLTGGETGSTCAFSLDGQAVYCGADDSYVRALSIVDGSLYWKFKTGQAVTSSAHVAKDGAIFIGSHDHFIYAIEPSGKLRWKVDLDGRVWSSPVSSSANGLVYVGSEATTAETVYALDMNSGRVVWKYLTQGKVIGSPCLSPDESMVCIGDSVGSLYCLGAAKGLHIWDKKIGNMIVSKPLILKDDAVVAGSQDGNLHLIDGVTGESLWSLNLSEKMSSSPTLGNGDILYIGGGNGTVHAVKRSSGEPIWATNIGQEIFVSSPRLSIDDHLYIGSVDGSIYCLNASSGDVIWKTKTEGPVVGTPLITKAFAAWYL